MSPIFYDKSFSMISNAFLSALLVAVIAMSLFRTFFCTSAFFCNSKQEKLNYYKRGFICSAISEILTYLFLSLLCSYTLTESPYSFEIKPPWILMGLIVGNWEDINIAVSLFLKILLGIIFWIIVNTALNIVFYNSNDESFIKSGYMGRIKKAILSTIFNFPFFFIVVLMNGINAIIPKLCF